MNYKSLDGINKFYFTFVTAAVVFLYKTFMNMYTERDKQRLQTDQKVSEMLSRLDVQIVIYLNGEKKSEDRAKLIERMGETYPYLDFKAKKKVRLYLTNFNESSIPTLGNIIRKKVDSLKSNSGRVGPIWQSMSFIYNLIKPIIPIVLLFYILYQGVEAASEIMHNNGNHYFKVIMMWVSQVISVGFLLAIVDDLSVLKEITISLFFLMIIVSPWIIPGITGVIVQILILAFITIKILLQDKRQRS